MSFLRTRISRVFGSSENSQDKDAINAQRQRIVSGGSTHHSPLHGPAATDPTGPAQHSLLELLKGQVFNHHGSSATSTTTRRSRAKSINDVASIKIKGLSESIRAKTHMFYTLPNGSTSTRGLARSQASLSSRHSQRSEAHSSLRSRRGGQHRGDDPQEVLNKSLPVNSKRMRVERHELDVSIPTSDLLEESSISNLRITVNSPPLSPARMNQNARLLRLDTSQIEVSDSNVSEYERERSSTSGTESFHLSPSTASAFLLTQNIPDRSSSRSNRSDSVNTSSNESRTSYGSRTSSFLALPSDIDSLLTLADSKRSSRHGSLFVKGNHDEQPFTISPYRKVMRKLKTRTPVNVETISTQTNGTSSSECPVAQEKSLIEGTSSSSDSSKPPWPPHHLLDVGNLVFNRYQAYAESSSGESDVPSLGPRKVTKYHIESKEQYQRIQAMSMETESDTETDASLSLRFCRADPAKSSSKKNHLEATTNVRDDSKTKSKAERPSIHKAVSLPSLSPQPITPDHVSSESAHSRKPLPDVLSSKVTKLAVCTANKTKIYELDLPLSLRRAIEAMGRPATGSTDSSNGVVALTADERVEIDPVFQKRPLQYALSPNAIKHAVEAINKVNGYTLELPDSLRLAIEAIERPCADKMESPLTQAMDDRSFETVLRRQSLYSQIPDLALTGHDTLAESALRAAAVGKSSPRVTFSEDSPRRHLYHSFSRRGESLKGESTVDFLSEVGSASSGTELELEGEEPLVTTVLKAFEEPVATGLIERNVTESLDHSTRCASSQSAATTDSCALTTHDPQCYSPIPASNLHRHSPVHSKTFIDNLILESLRRGDDLGDPYINNHESIQEDCKAFIMSTPVTESYDSTANTAKSEIIDVEPHEDIILPTHQSPICPLQPESGLSAHTMRHIHDWNNIGSYPVGTSSSASVIDITQPREISTSNDIEVFPLLPVSMDDDLNSGTSSFFASLHFPRTPVSSTPVGEQRLWPTPESEVLTLGSAEEALQNKDESWVQDEAHIEQTRREILASCINLRAQIQINEELPGGTDVEGPHPLTRERLGIEDELKCPFPIRLSSSTYSVLSTNSTQSSKSQVGVEQMTGLPPLPPPSCITPYSTPRREFTSSLAEAFALNSKILSKGNGDVRELEQLSARTHNQRDAIKCSDVTNGPLTEADECHEADVQKLSLGMTTAQQLSDEPQRIDLTANNHQATGSECRERSFIAARLPRFESSSTLSDLPSSATTRVPQDKDVLITSSMKKGVWWQRDDESFLANDEVPEPSPLAGKADAAANLKWSELHGVDMLEIDGWVWVFNREVTVIEGIPCGDLEEVTTPTGSIVYHFTFQPISDCPNHHT